MGLYLGNTRISNLGETFTPLQIQSVNGKTSVEGEITVYGSDISVSQSDNRTVELALSSIPTKTSLLTNDSGFTTNIGTITGINMNGSSKGTSGIVNLGTVLTSVPTASSSTIGGVKINGNNLAILDDGTLSAAAGGGGGGGGLIGYTFHWDSPTTYSPGECNNITMYFYGTDGSLVDSKTFIEYALDEIPNFTVSNVCLMIYHLQVTMGYESQMDFGFGSTKSEASSHQFLGSKGLINNTYTGSDSYGVIFLINDLWILYAKGDECLDGSTLVTMSDRSLKRIDLIHSGDKVLAYDADTKQLVEDEIIFSDANQIKVHDIRDVWTFEDGYKLITIHDHELYNVEKGGMKYMKDWNIGEHAITIEGKEISLISHDIEHGSFRHFKITGHHHNFFVNGILNGDRYSKISFKD